MQLYESIWRRKSTRKYKNESISQEQLSVIMEFVKSIKPLYPQIRTKIELVSESDVKGMVSAKAPHYLLFYSETAEGYLPNAGFMLQQADLFLSSQKFGSCWLGMAKTTAPAKDGLDYIIMLAFGTALDSPYRKDASEFKRKPLSELSTGKDERLEAARLAPSATNSQPWYFVCEQGKIHIYRKKLGVLKAIMYETMNQIDMGIALCHLWLASEHCHRPFTYETLDAANVNGYIYLGSLV